MGQDRNKDFLEFNENEYITYPNLWATWKGCYMNVKGFPSVAEKWEGKSACDGYSWLPTGLQLELTKTHTVG